VQEKAGWLLSSGIFHEKCSWLTVSGRQLALCSPEAMQIAVFEDCHRSIADVKVGSWSLARFQSHTLAEIAL
jgi:hypothetical protein